MVAFVSAHLGRQFKFVQSQWMNDGVFFRAGNARDPVAGAYNDPYDFAVPRRPMRRRLPSRPQFVVMRRGEYGLMPGLTALRWLGDLQD